MSGFRSAALPIAAIVLAFAAAPAGTWLPSPARAAGASPLDTLVAAERAFAAMSVEHGMKAAFLAHLADDAVVFRPAPASGRQVWRARTESAATLAWAPDYAEVAGHADLGVTSGPWEFRPARGDAPAAYGHFVSVWKRAKDGRWRVAADIGIEHERPAAGPDAAEVQAGPVHPKPPPLPREFRILWDGALFATGPGYVPLADRLMARARNDMMRAERDLVYDIRNRGVERAYPAHAAADVRVYRGGTLPMVGVAGALGALSARGRRVEIAPRGDGMSSSHDLGYSYGLLITRASADARPDTVSYLHVWRRDDDGVCKLAVDVENQFRKR